jgi:hypothetical protein
MNRKTPLILLAVCAGLFVAGIARLFELRFESGDVYPAYSSLRADPLGTSAFYESLAKMPGIEVSRDFSANDELPEGRGTAYLHLAGRSGEWRELPEDTFREVESFAKSGGRLVVAFYPETTKSYFETAREERLKEEARTGKPGDAGRTNSAAANTNSVPIKPARAKRNLRDGPDELFREVSLKEHWGIDFAFKGLPPGQGGAYEPVEAENRKEPDLPASVSWHSSLCFTNLDKAWKVVYARGDTPVMVERRFGAGSVVFCADSYFLSNEAMLKERHADLLAWLIGPSSRVVFDEAHLGIVEQPGVAMLIRKYHLQWVGAGLLLLAALFIWKSSARFAPEAGEEKAEDYVTGKDSAAGFVNLLRRHISSRDVLGVCVAEWQKSIVRGKYPAARLKRVKEAMDAENGQPASKRNPVGTYLAVCRTLNDRTVSYAVDAAPDRPANPASKEKAG